MSKKKLNRFNIEKDNNVPSLLKKINQWTLYEENKIPHQVNGRKARANHRDTFNTYDNVIDTFKDDIFKKYNGPGFFLTVDDKIIALDLDKCRDEDTGKLTTDAKRIVETMNSYTEISPSGKGLKILFKIKAEKQKETKYRVKYNCFDFKELEIIYKTKYTTITGELLDSKYNKLEERETEFLEFFKKHLKLKGSSYSGKREVKKIREIIKKDYNALNTRELKAKIYFIIDKLKRKNSYFNYYYENGYKTDDDKSSIDLKLVNLIEPYTRQVGTLEAFYIIDTIISKSRVYRAKWDRLDYKTETINKALIRRS